MLEVKVRDEFVQSLANEIKEQLVPVLLQELQENQLPPLLSRKEFMELVGISDTKCNEIFNRQDFYPVTRELGHPKVVTKLFFEWLNEKAGRSEEFDFKYPFKVI